MTALQGKNVLITGGSRGIGPFIAEALAMRGAHIALAARSEEGLRRTASALGRFGTRTVTVPADLARDEDRRRTVHAVMERFGSIDVLVNNAGIENEGAFAGLPWDQVRELIDVDLLAPLHISQLVLPQMLQRRSGHIVNIASIAAQAPAPYDAVYSGAKAGLAAWAQAMRLELAGSGVRFSTIFPGYITGTGMFARFGLTTPWMIGSCTPAQVANAVVEAIERNRRERIVNSRPLRGLFALAELSPALRDRIMVLFGAVEFQRKKAGP